MCVLYDRSARIARNLNAFVYLELMKLEAVPKGGFLELPERTVEIRLTCIVDMKFIDDSFVSATKNDH